MAYYWWLIAAIIFCVAEIITSGFVVLWFGIGALAAALCEFCGMESALGQTLVFSVVSIILVAMSRTIFKNIFIKKSPGNKLKSFMESLPGSIGVVTDEINNELSSGRVLVKGQDWSAQSKDNSIIAINDKVKIIAIEGVKLFVIKAE